MTDKQYHKLLITYIFITIYLIIIYLIGYYNIFKTMEEAYT